MLKLVLILLTTLPFGGLPWRSVGPVVSGGRVASVVGSESDPAFYFVGTAGGGAWSTSNAGQSWRPLFDGQSVAAVGAVAIGGSDRDLWVCTGESNPRNDIALGNGVYHSLDGGSTWTRVLALPSTTVGKILVDPKDPKRVVVAVLGNPFGDSTERGIYRSTDGGATWSKTLYLSPDSGGIDLAATPDDGTLFAAMWEFRRTPWSSNSGGPHDGLFVSHDFGATWHAVHGNGFPDGTLGRIAVAIAPSQPKRVYAIVQNAHGLLYISTDGGTSWHAGSSDPLIDERPFYFSRLYVNPTNPLQVYSDSVHLTVSQDGGHTFSIAGHGLHGDHHAMWISNDGRRIIEGNDGGVVFSVDGGASWRRNLALPISQPYHVGIGTGRIFGICAPLQDNGVWCGRSNTLAYPGITAGDWHYIGGGDGAWALIDPMDYGRVWASSGGGNFGGEIDRVDVATGVDATVSPYLRDQNVVDPVRLQYRMNWETPLAGDPFDARAIYTAGNVVWVTRDEGMHWTQISGDLTRNDPTHQHISGGLTLDGTGAETSDTILDIAPSPVVRGIMWIGTDDGLVHVTRDSGKHWRNVTPAGILSWGRFASISPDAFQAGTAYAAYDRHMLGDNTAYLFVTHDFGATWKRIDAGLPAMGPVRSVLVDRRDAEIVYAGMERGIAVSFDRGNTWSSLRNNLAAVSVRDIQYQPDADALVIATHGRGIYVLDDLQPLREFAEIANDAAWLAPPQRAFTRSMRFRGGLRYNGANPPNGASITYYLRAPLANAPTAQILDSQGHVVRAFTVEGPKHTPVLENTAGYHTFTWDLNETPAHAWKSAPGWNSGSDAAVQVLPGRYEIVLHAGALTLHHALEVGSDPRVRTTSTALRASYAMSHLLVGDLSALDDALNRLDAVHATAMIATVTSSPKNDQDDDFLEDLLRERLQTQIQTMNPFVAPTAEQIRETAKLHALTRAALAKINAYLSHPQ